MGLEAVELLLAVEDEFQIRIPDNEAAKIFTVGELHAAVKAKQRQDLSDDQIWNKLKKIIVEQLVVRPEEVIPTARIRDDLGAN